MESRKGMRLVLAGVLLLAMATAGIAQEAGEGAKMTTKETAAMVEKPVVVMETSMGDIHLELDAKKAPVTVSNFLSYVRDGFYNGLIFHRVIDNFMIQTGGFEPGMIQKRGKQPIKNEAANGLKNDLGTIAMARTAVVNSATSQFFINVKDNTFLNHRDETQRGFGYCVFGKVIKGMDVVDKIKKVKTTSTGGHGDVPVEPILIKKAYVVGEGGEKEVNAQMIEGKKTSSTDMKAEKLDPAELDRPKK